MKPESEILFNLRQLMDLEARKNGGLNPPRELTDRERLEFSAEVYEAAVFGTETFRGRVGTDLAYLMGAIVKGTKTSMSPRKQLWKILADHFGPKPGKMTMLMRFVELEGT